MRAVCSCRCPHNLRFGPQHILGALPIAPLDSSTQTFFLVLFDANIFSYTFNVLTRSYSYCTTYLEKDIMQIFNIKFFLILDPFELSAYLLSVDGSVVSDCFDQGTDSIYISLDPSCCRLLQDPF